MPTSSLMTTYFRVIWNGATPTNYNGLTGNQAGGIDNTNAENYLRNISITGTAYNPTVTAGHSIVINNIPIVFTSTTLSQCIIDINSMSWKTGVQAHQGYVQYYLTLENAIGYSSQSFSVEAGSGTALSDLGLTANTYSNWPKQLGSTLTLPLTNGNNININGVNIVFTTAGGLNLAGVVNTINSYSSSTNVIAYASANTIQLTSNGQPWNLTNGSAGTLAAIGFTAGTYGGSPSTLTQSINKELSNMRWLQIVNNLGSIVSPVYLSDFSISGVYDGSAPVTTLSFTVGYDRPEYLQIEDVNNPGTYLYGANAVKRLISSAVTNYLGLTNYGFISNQEIYDPTITLFGNRCNRVNPSQIVQLMAEPLDTSLTTVEANLSISIITTV